MAMAMATREKNVCSALRVGVCVSLSQPVCVGGLFLFVRFPTSLLPLRRLVRDEREREMREGGTTRPSAGDKRGEKQRKRRREEAAKI